MTLHNLPPLRNIIARHQLTAYKHFGQNFLLDMNLTNKIARIAGDLSRHNIIEIGPGPGGLTRSLLLAGAQKLLVIERDARFLPALNEIKKYSNNRLQIIHGDALKINPLQYITPPIKIVANMPYNIATKLLIQWMSAQIWPQYWQSLTLMFQQEVAERIVAPPNNKSYGRLSILVGWRANAKIVMKIPARAFTPPPKVDSAVVYINRCDQAKFAANQEKLTYIVARCFQQRRKMLRVSLKSVDKNIESILCACHISPKQRPQTLSIEQFCTLARAIKIA